MNIRVTQAAEGLARRAFTVKEILRMVETGILHPEERFELIKGEIVPMSPKGNQHEVVKLDLVRILVTTSPADLRVGVESTLYLDDDTFLEPDITLYPKRLLPEDVKGSDIILAVEVADSSLRYDRGFKARLYAKYGVQELWVIDAPRRSTFVHLSPMPDGTWAEVKEVSGTTKLTPKALPDIKIKVADLD